MLPPCDGLTDLFFPEHPDPAKEKQAKQMCTHCFMFDACKERGKHETYGIWAGENKEKRR